MSDNTNPMNLPWCRMRSACGHIVILDCTGEQIAVIDGEQSAHSDLVLRAVNSHQALIDAAERVQAPTEEHDSDCSCAHCNLREAVRQAKGEV